jgi:hypothetical protein
MVMGDVLAATFRVLDGLEVELDGEVELDSVVEFPSKDVVVGIVIVNSSVNDGVGVGASTVD